VHSGQHYDDGLSEQFFREFTLKTPKYNLEIGSASHNIFIARFLMGFDAILDQENPDMVVVVGDTNTTAAAAIASAKRNIPLSHVEAGLREWDKTVPEEVNKLITDSISDLYFTPTKTGVENLIAEGVSKHVYMTGDITLDLLVDDQYILDEKSLKARYKLSGDYVFMTCHRAVNTDNFENLNGIVNAVNSVDLPVVWSLHPRTKAALKRESLINTLGDHIKLIPPISYKDSQSLIKYASRVLTDSGGVIKEAYFHKTRGIIIDTQTEWIETVEEGWNIVAGPNTKDIIAAYENNAEPQDHSNALGDGQAGFRIIREIYKYLENRK
ncbi:UDP-N-acetylglucosamine 2-epimerase (non-hydrolyzing), partial [Saprospiraceae bacterium]|nr:UDP-N-acetylglucosamine 2-epimerase (non-hydrolyzing) [Saprospiraceae bacterium]